MPKSDKIVSTERIQSNSPDLWLEHFPEPEIDGNKYHRGYAAIFAAPSLTGATRLCAAACSRVGCGLVSVIAKDRGDVFRSTLPPDIMVHDIVPKKTTVLLGGSGGISDEHFSELLNSSQPRTRVFDADALPGRQLFDSIDSNCILTPHTGEFERAFGTSSIERPEILQQISNESSATIVLKSHQTLIAAPNASLVINTHTSPYLAKAGTGDVLAGLIAGLVAQGMPSFEAACAAVWVHGEAGIRIGPGLIAGDIPNMVPYVLRDLLQYEKTNASLLENLTNKTDIG